MHLRSLLPSLLVLTSVLQMPLMASAAQFRDLTGSGYDTAITTLAEAGVISGYPDGTVQPYNVLNRAEALKVVFNNQPTLKTRAERMKASMPPLPLFSDVDQLSWYAPYVEAGFEVGIVKGYADGLFRPSRTLTIEEAIALLLRSYGEKGDATFRTSTTMQNSPGQWYTPYISAALAKNLVSDREKLLIGKPVTRGQFFDIVYRLRQVKNANLLAYVDTDLDRRPVAAQPIPHASYGSNNAAVQYASSKPFAISMPTLGILDLAIHHPEDPFTNKGVTSVLDSGVGHLFSYPGEGGKIMVYGHSSGYPWDISQYTKIFRRINELNPGDRAYVTYAGKLYVYEVTHEETVHAEDSEPFEPDENGEELILYTCWPPDTVDERYLVYLKPIEVISL